MAQGKVYGEVQDFEVQRTPFVDQDGNSMWLHPKVIHPLLDLVEQANKDGHFIKLNSAHRSHKHQRRLWLRMPDVAGHPDKQGPYSHQTGYSIDIAGTLKKFSHKQKRRWERRNKRKMRVSHCDKRNWGYICPTILYWWLKRNAPLYGFINDVRGERWHWTYRKKED